ncbi:ABC transporter ATP-binding protein, partial [Erysipelatoclostridium ramosum]|nr:ABC transporter ATP-binding protein [Thomasclavelia ramosa]
MSKEILLRADKLLIYTQAPQSDLEAAATRLWKRPAAFQGIEIVQPTLEDVYLRLTQNERRENK